MDGYLCKAKSSPISEHTTSDMESITLLCTRAKCLVPAREQLRDLSEMSKALTCSCDSGHTFRQIFLAALGHGRGEPMCQQHPRVSQWLLRAKFCNPFWQEQKDFRVLCYSNASAANHPKLFVSIGVTVIKHSTPSGPMALAASGFEVSVNRASEKGHDKN